MKYVYVKEIFSEGGEANIYRVYEDNSYSMLVCNEWINMDKNFRWVKDGYTAYKQKIISEKEVFVEML